MEPEVLHKDVVIAFLGASAGMAGLVLVFMGLVVAAYGGLAGDTPKAVKRPLRITGRVLLVAFGLGVSTMVIAGAWLVWPDGAGWLYVLTIILFAAELFAVAGAAVWTLRELLWD